MNENKQALQVAALRDGTVIDHIPSEKLFTIVRLLGLEHMTNNITIGFNLESKKLGRKGSSELIAGLVPVPCRIVERGRLADEVAAMPTDVVISFGAGNIDACCGALAERLRAKS